MFLHGKKEAGNLSIWLAQGEEILKGEWGMVMKLSAEGNLPKYISRHYIVLIDNGKDRDCYNSLASSFVSTHGHVFPGARCGWRERENGLDGDWDDGSGRGTGRGVPVTSRNTRQPWDDKDGHHRKSWEEDNLPEW